MNVTPPTPDGPRRKLGGGSKGGSDGRIPEPPGPPRADFDALYQQHSREVWALAYARWMNADTALDVMQETFAYLFGKFPGFVLTARMTTFLYPVVRNLSIAARRKRHRLAADQVLLDPVAPPGRQDERAREELAMVLKSLPDIQREVLLMRFVDDLKLSEIAEALGIPEGTVKSRLHNALTTLKHDPRVREYFRER